MTDIDHRLTRPVVYVGRACQLFGPGWEEGGARDRAAE